MTTLNHEIYINAPKSQVWDVILTWVGLSSSTHLSPIPIM